jgi:aspartyl protease family protein
MVRVVGAVLGLGATVLDAAPEIRVVGLFPDHAVVMVDGRTRSIAAGETSREGVTLISADSEQAVLEFNGEMLTATLDGRISTRVRAAGREEAQIWRDAGGTYSTVGTINGYPVNFLVDTGATQIAMNAAQARRLGIDFRVVGTPARVTTASGNERAFMVSLDTVKVGNIVQRNVRAVVLDGARPDQVLLGMSFLGRVNLTNDGHRMTLRSKF